MPPNYELRDFWEDRFKRESHFEWLGDGQETLLPVLRTHLQNPPASYDSSHPPRVLHIGAGTSTFSDSIVEEYRKIYGANAASEVIANVDFAQEAVDRGRERAKERGHTEVAWERIDLLDLDDILALRASIFRTVPEERFEVVLDKSTSDAISCGEDIAWDRTKLERYPQRLHPFVVDALSALPKVVVVLRRMDILAVHLALLVRPGGLWIALSYSKFRFQHLQEPSEADLEERIDVGRLWRLAGVVPVTAPSGRADDEAREVHTPEISHYLYVLRRTDVAVE